MREPRRISDAEVETAYRYLAPYMDESGDLSPAGAKHAIKEAMSLASMVEPEVTVIEYSTEATAEEVTCTCPMSLRELGKHSVSCPTRQPLSATEREALDNQSELPPCMGCGRPDDHNGNCQR
jgi:hypothetical protein